MGTKKPDIIQKIRALSKELNTEEDVTQIFNIYKESHDRLQRYAVAELDEGDEIIFNGRGVDTRGIIIKINQKTLKVQTKIGIWTTYASKVVKNVTKERANVK